MAPSEHNEADAPASTFAVQRLVLYTVIVTALILIVWALIKGADRDLWTQPIGFGPHAIAVLVP